ncbi:MAG TPA: hypothetical protein VHM27_13655 [Rhizomicrobium sp.]|nr:hypothetical protein [Rhizomicrobium sp.]
MTFRQTLKRILTPPLFVVAAAYVLFEDTILHWASLGMRRLAKLPAIAWLERQLRRLPPYPAMLVFLVPIGLLFPVKLLALWAIATGHAITGLLIIILAKTLSTALGAWLYGALRPVLGQLPWFVRAETWVFSWRDRLYGYVRSLKAWQVFQAWLARIKASLRNRSWLGRRFAAMRRRPTTPPPKTPV